MLTGTELTKELRQALGPADVLEALHRAGAKDIDLPAASACYDEIYRRGEAPSDAEVQKLAGRVLWSSYMDELGFGAD
ncbi:MAG: hypothetical protein LBL67_06155 [Coriobacteriales bacterium]|jgi:hypothetical protein|nr:hypothetical protein [Coriobacteriales bacterium]